MLSWRGQRGWRCVMYCPACGVELPDVANFCWKCGKDVRDGKLLEAEWEYCTLEHRCTGPTRKYHVGLAVRSDGTMVTREMFYSDRDWSRIHMQIVARLSNDGWEPIITTMRRRK